MKTLIMTVGLPRSGKSTWARSTGFPMVSPDAIRLSLHGQRHLPQADPMVWTIAKYMTRSLFIAGHNHVVLDSTMPRRHDRSVWLSRDWETCVKIFDTDIEVCKERAVACGQVDLLEVIDRMGDEFAHYDNRSELALYRQW